MGDIVHVWLRVLWCQYDFNRLSGAGNFGCLGEREMDRRRSDLATHCVAESQELDPVAAAAGRAPWCNASIDKYIR